MHHFMLGYRRTASAPRRALVSAAILLAVLSVAAAGCKDTSGTDRATVVWIMEQDGGMSAQQAACVYDTVRAQFDELQVNAIVRTSSGKPDENERNALPADLRAAYDAAQGTCGIDS